MSVLTTQAHAHKVPGQENPEEGDGLELPVNPDEGTPLVPNEDGEITVPS